MMQGNKLTPFGIEITGLDLRKLRSGEESAELLKLFNEHYLLIVRGQDLNEEQHRRVFHDLFPGEDLADESGTGSEISYVSNVRPDGIFGDVPLAFHSDFAFTTDPTRLISLYGMEVDPGSAPTEFSSGELALQTISPKLLAYITDKKVVCATDLMAYNTHLPSFNLAGREDLSGRRHDEIVRAAWPVIMAHPRTGRPLIYVNELHAHHLHGVPLAESRAALETLCEHLYREEHIYSHNWQQGDFVLWDNVALAHGRRATAAQTAKRTLRRVRGGGATVPTVVSLSQIGLDQSETDYRDDKYLSPEQWGVRRVIAARIRNARIEQNLTQQDLSRKCGIDFEYIEKFEAATWLASNAQLEAIARSLNMGPTALTEGITQDSAIPA